MFHYDASKKLRTLCDASHTGLGAALEQAVEQGIWAPIALKSRFVNQVEQKYSSNELELLAVVWSWEYFKKFLLGNHFYFLTYHKALVTALKENRGNRAYQSRLTR